MAAILFFVIDDVIASNQDGRKEVGYFRKWSELPKSKMAAVSHSKRVEITINGQKRCSITWKLVNKHFPRGSELYKLFNRNTVKVSYCTMNNMSSIISSHNAKILNDDTQSNHQKKCNCRKPDECPLDGNCLAENIVYKAAVSTRNEPTKYYYGMSEGDFKHRWSDHKTSFSSAKYRSKTELAQYVWSLKEKHKIPLKEINIKWSIDRRSSKYRCGTRRCDLCISEKLSILNADPTSLLNSRDEIVSFCRHMSKFRYKNIAKVRKRKAKTRRRSR